MGHLTDDERDEWEDEQRRDEQHGAQLTVETNPFTQTTERTQPEFQREDAVSNDLR